MRNALLCAVATLASAINNGRGVTPPMGWRSWNQIGANPSQTIMMTQMQGVANRSHSVNGVPTSLLDLGYSDVGLDDFWQKCGSYGPNHYTYHDGAGYPVVNPDRFPDMLAMTNFAHSLGETAGWYGNNCDCSDSCSLPMCYAGDAAALIEFGFDSVKLDNCGAEHDLDIWAGLYNASGRSIMIENCHWGQTIPNATWCPFNYYRSSGDIRANYGSIVANLQTVIPLATQGLSTPGCWAFPDALEVGVYDGPGGPGGDSGLSFVEARSHFGAWCVVSSPLILGFDTTNQTAFDNVWPIISNKQAIGINQAWYGSSGNLFSQASSSVNLATRVSPSVSRAAKYGGVVEPTILTVAQWQQYAKPLNATSVAVLVMNHDTANHTIAVNFTAVPGLGYTGGSVLVHDVWAQADIGTFSGTWPTTLVSHDSSFIILTPA